MSKFFLFLMGLETFIRILLLNLLLVDDLFPYFLEFTNKVFKGIEYFQTKSIWGIFGVIKFSLWSKTVFSLEQGDIFVDLYNHVISFLDLYWPFFTEEKPYMH
jgi:hypothetical protein